MSSLSRIPFLRLRVRALSSPGGHPTARVNVSRVFRTRPGTCYLLAVSYHGDVPQPCSVAQVTETGITVGLRNRKDDLNRASTLSGPSLSLPSASVGMVCPWSQASCPHHGSSAVTVALGTHTYYSVLTQGRSHAPPASRKESQ